MTVPYTDAEGVVHIWAMSTAKTLCGEDTGLAGQTRPKAACDACVTESINDLLETEARRLCGGSEHDQA